MNINTIENIKTKVSEIREKIGNIDFNKFKEQTYGNENEYTYQSLMTELEKLLTDLTTLVENPNKFIEISIHSERTSIVGYLNNISTYLENPSSLLGHINNLKILLRNYNLRDFSEHKIVFEKEIDSVRNIKMQLENILKQSKSLQKNITDKETEISSLHQEIQKELDDSKNKFSEISNTLSGFSDEVAKQKSLNTELSNISSQANESLRNINTYKLQAEANKNSTEGFAKSLQEKEKKLLDVERRAETNTANFDKYEEERKRILEEANTLIKSAKQALEYKTAEGLSAAFNSQYKEANSKWYFLWILGAVVCLGGAGYFGWRFMESVSEDKQWFVILGRVLLLPIPIMGAIFCANQYTKQKNIIEDYAYKQTIAKAIVGFSEQLKKNEKYGDNSEYVDYIRQALGEIHKDPLRSRKEDKPLLNLKNNQFEQVIELAKKIIDVGKQGN